MTITLPEEWRERLENRAKLNRFASVEEYLLSLAEAEEQESNHSGPPEISPQNRAELDAMLGVGMASGPPVRVTSEFWEERRRVLEERMAKRKGSAS
ncbi:MAG: hypothetical protein K8U57_22355 [Planctomycetes bacterium]|nr:hypothetical protein [Planctomycetota bacterium]